MKIINIIIFLRNYTSDSKRIIKFSEILYWETAEQYKWLPYKPLGTVIEGTRFIAFKVPLNRRFFNAGRDIPSKDHFTPQILLDEIRDLGLIIDLTATTRYYDPAEFEDNDVQYIKIFTEGHQVPSRNVVSKFTMAVNNFLERNGHNDKKIGVHCTHGINRTGYLICRYMIIQMKMGSKEAIERFASCRGYPIERDNYIESLNSLLVAVAVPKNDDKRDDLSKKRVNGKRKPNDERRDLIPSRPLELSTTRRISRVSRVTDRNDRIEHRTILPNNYDRTRSYSRPQGNQSREPTYQDQPYGRRQEHSNNRNYDHPARGDSLQNIYNNYRPRDNSNGRPPIVNQPPCHFSRYLPQNRKTAVPSSAEQLPKHR